MTRTLKGSLLIASMLVVLWTTSSEACHRRRSCQPTSYCQSGYAYASQRATTATRAHRATTVPVAATPWLTGATTAAGMPAARPAIPAGTASPATGYDFGRPGTNPGGLGGPASGIGVRPGLGAGGFGPGR